MASSKSSKINLQDETLSKNSGDDGDYNFNESTKLITSNKNRKKSQATLSTRFDTQQLVNRRLSDANEILLDPSQLPDAVDDIMSIVRDQNGDKILLIDNGQSTSNNPHETIILMDDNQVNTSKMSGGGADNSDSTSLTTLSLSNGKSPPDEQLSVNIENKNDLPVIKDFLESSNDSVNNNHNTSNLKSDLKSVNFKVINGSQTINRLSESVKQNSDNNSDKNLINNNKAAVIVQNSKTTTSKSKEMVHINGNNNGKEMNDKINGQKLNIEKSKFKEKELSFSNDKDKKNSKNGIENLSNKKRENKESSNNNKNDSTSKNGSKNGPEKDAQIKNGSKNGPEKDAQIKNGSKNGPEKDAQIKKDQLPVSNGKDTSSNKIDENLSDLSDDKNGPKKDGKQVPLFDSEMTSEAIFTLRGMSPAEKLILLCSREEWLAVDTLLHHTEPDQFDKNIVAEGTLWTAIMFAAKDNRVNIIEKLLDYGYEINSRAKDGTTALHLACAHAREDTVRLLLSRKADPLIAGGPKDQLPIHIVASKPTGQAVAPLQLLIKSSAKSMQLIPDKDGNIPLILATEAGNHGVCRELLKSQSKDQMMYQKPGLLDTVAHIATRKKDFELLALFIEQGANANAQNINGQTPLHIASAEGDEKIVNYLHGFGANANILDNEERTALHLAAENGHTRVVDILTEKYRANLHLRTKDGSTLMHIASRSGQSSTALNFLKRGVPLHMPNRNGAKAIHIAAAAGQVDIIKHVLKNGENVDIMTNGGLTPLHLAVQAGQSEVVEVLLGWGASVHCETTSTQETPLHIAAKTKKGVDAARLLIKSGANVNAVEKNGESPLHLAGRFGFLDTFRLLLNSGADPTLQNKLGENILHVSVREGHFLIASHLINHIIKKNSPQAAEALVNQRNKNGESSVHYTATIEKAKSYNTNFDKELISLLLKNGGDVNLGTNETCETSVHYCCKSGNTNVLQEIINQLPPIDAQIVCNKPSKNRWTPLLYACNYGHPEIIRLLLTQNARVDVFDDRGRAGLHLAAELGHLDLVDILLANNAFVNVRNKTGMTPLHIAAKMGYNEMIKHLVEKYEAHTDAMTLTKQTPLHLAAENGQLEVCNTLLNMKADINAMDNQSQTPLHLAAQSDHPEVLKLFLQHRPELVSVPNKNGFTCAHIAATKGSVAVLRELMKFNVEVVKSARIKKTGSTALHLAAEGGHSKVVRLLLQAGAKASDENMEGMTPLHLAAKQGHLRVLTALKGSVDPKICSRKTGFTALHVAAANGQIDFVSEMLTQISAGITSERPLIDPTADYGITPLHLAAQNGHESVVRLLMNSTGVQVDAPTRLQGVIPMHLAAQGGHVLVAGLLVSRSAESLHIKDKQGRTCLHLSAASGHRDMVGLLLGQGAEINSQDKKGWSPLHYAARNGFLNVVSLLIDSGADPTATTKDGKVALCCAAAAGHIDVLSYLLNQEHDPLVLMDDKTFLLDLMNCAKNHNNKPIREFVLVSEACIDTAVKLARQYENIAIREKERARDLVAASKYCDQIAIDLMSIAATTNNAGALLRATDYRNVEFLDVLIELDRKDVVAQHAVQKYLTDVWMGNLSWPGIKFVLLFFASLLCPLIWIFISTPIGHRLHRIPIIKFMSYLCSHIFFIILLIYTIVFPSIKLYEYTSNLPLWNEWLLFLWLIGILVSDIINPSDKSGLGGIKVLILTIGFTAVIVHIIVNILDAFVFHRNQLLLDEIWNVHYLDTLYIRNQLLAVSMLLSFIEFLNFLIFHPLFGPWGVIIQQLIQDLLRFLAILSIFLAGFTLHICAIYQPVYRAPDSWNMTSLPIGRDFLKPGKSFEMLFYALFGLVEPDTMPPMHLSPDFAKIIMKLVFGVYMMVTVIVLINLLIAMMSNTYQRIEAQSDIEWKFGRAKLIRNMNRTLSTPSPINLLLGIPIIFYHKIKTKWEKQSKLRDMQLAKRAFGHLAGQRPSVIAAKQLLYRKSSKISATTQVTNPFGVSVLEAAINDSKPITMVVNWKTIVQKYYESIGEALPQTVTEQDNNDDSSENIVLK